MKKGKYLSLFWMFLLIQTSIAQQTYESSWESIGQHQTPQWFREAKFGIFVCWGLYSVPAWSPKGTYSEWYQYWLQQKSCSSHTQKLKGDEVYRHHVAKYGQDFKYKDFAPLFKAEQWKPEEWAELFDAAGARYVVFTTKHHSGYCMWPSKEASQAYEMPWNSLEVGPKMDITGDLTKAVRDKGLKMGLYYSLYEWYHPLWKMDKERFVSEHMFPQLKDLVLSYQPDMIWADGEWPMSWEKWRSPEIVSWMYNHVKDPDNFLVNDRWGKCRHQYGDFYTTEYGSGLDSGEKAWEENRGIGLSYGLNREEDIQDYRSSKELILMLVDIVSRGGNLCLDIGPDADGNIPPIMQERLLQMGQWLKTNGEAIYATHPWKVSCQWSEGVVPQIKRGDFMSHFDILEQTINPKPGNAVKEVYFTQKGNKLFAITPKWLGKQLVIKNCGEVKVKKVTFLENDQQLKWKKRGENLIVSLPSFDPEKIKSPCGYSFCIETE